MHSLGCDVCGSDRAEAMLTQAEGNLVPYHLDVSLTQVDFRELPLNYARGFDAGVCLFSLILEVPE